MGIPVNILLGQMSSRQLTAYQTSYRIDPPFNGSLLIHMFARFMAMFWNVHRRKGSAAKSASDFLPDSMKTAPQRVSRPSGDDDTNDPRNRTLEQANALWDKVKKGFGFG